MRPDIFGLLQGQLNSLSNTSIHTTQQQDDSGVRAGIFDALMTEYAAQVESQPQEIPHSENISQPITPFNIASFPNIIASNETEQTLPENVNDDKSGWRNLFAQSRRLNVQRRGENSMPENDFDAGVVEVVADEDSQLATHEPERMSRELLPDMAGKKPETVNEPVMIESDTPEISQPTHTPDTLPEISQPMHTPDTLPEISQPTRQTETPPEIPTITPEIMKAVDVLNEALNDDTADITQPALNLVALLTANHDMPITPNTTLQNDEGEYHISVDNAQEFRPNITGNDEPEFSQAIHAPETLPEFSQAMNTPETQPEISQTMRNFDTQPATPPITPEITQTDSPNNDESEILQPAPNLNAYTAQNDAPANIAPETLTQESYAEITPNDSAPATPRKIPQAPQKFDTPPAIPRMTPEITQAVSVLAEAINDGNTDIRQPAQELVSLITAQNDSHVSIDAQEPEILQAVSPVEAPRANHEDVPPAEDDSSEITHDPLNMAGVAGVQVVAQESQAPAQNDSASQESQTQSRERPRISRNESPRMTRESHSGINEADSDSNDDSSPVTFTRNEARQDSRNDDSAGHEAMNDSPDNDSPAQVTSRNSRGNSATAQPTRNESPRTSNERQTPARTDAHNDFASFFDGAIRTRRTASRTPAQPLSLRTAEYTPTRPGIVREGIINTVRFIRADGMRKANIIIDPPALGRISVEIVSSSSGVEASVKVASEQIRQIVQEQITQLRDNLSQQGVQVSEFTVDVQQDSTGQGQNSGHEDRRSPYSFTAQENDDDVEEFRIDLEEGLLYWVA